MLVIVKFEASDAGSDYIDPNTFNSDDDDALVVPSFLGLLSSSSSFQI